MNITQEICEEYVEQGWLNRNVNGAFTLYCYSKDAFFKGHWDEITTMSRGLVFYNGQQVNHPFPKIFNLDEHHTVSSEIVMSLIESNEPHVELHKVNGHLTIVDYIPQLDKFLVHTKGSLQDNEMNQFDKEMFFTQHSNMITKIRENQAPITLMFESLHESDPHTLYDQEVARYGENTLVLLGGYYKNYGGIWEALPLYSLQAWARISGTPCVEAYELELTKDKINEMFAETDTEGYVIWFPRLDLRVKIKTTDYWKMRFRKELTADTIIDRFVSGGDGRLYNRYPEEIADKVVELITQYFDRFVVNDCVANIDKGSFLMSRKEIGLSKTLSKIQKSLIFKLLDNAYIDSKVFMSNKTFRLAFKDYMDYNESYKVDIKDQLIQFIENRKV